MSIDVAPEAEPTKLEKARHFLTALRVDVTAIEPAHRMALLQQRVNTIASSEIADAIAQESQLAYPDIPEVHNLAMERSKVLKEAAAKRAKARADIERASPKRIAPEKGLGDFLENAADTVLPQPLKRRLSRDAKIGAATLAVVPVALFAAYWIGKGVKRGLDIAGSGIRKLWRASNGLLVVGGIGALAYFGVPKAVALHDSYTKVKNLLGKGPEELQRMLQEAKQRNDLDAIQKIRKAIKAKQKKPETVQDSQDITEPHLDALDAAERAKRASRSFLVVGLLIRHRSLAEDASINFSNETEIEKVSDILANPDVRSLSMRQLADASTTVEQVTALFPSKTLTPEQQHALHFLGLVCCQERTGDNIADSISSTGKTLDSIDVGTFIDCISIVPQLFGSASKAFAGKEVLEFSDPSEVTKSLFSEETTTQQILTHPTIRSRLSEVHSQCKDPEFSAEFSFYIFGPGGVGKRTIADIVTEEPEHKNEEAFLEILSDIHTELLSPAVRNYLIQYGQEEHFSQVIQGYMDGNLSVRDAVQLFMYLQLVRKSDGSYPTTVKESSATGAFMLQMKMLDIVSDVDKTQGIHMRNMLLADTALGKINLPEGALDHLKTVAGIAKDASLQWFQDLAVWLWREVSADVTDLHTNASISPWFIGGEAGAGSAVALMVYRYFKYNPPETRFIRRLGNVHEALRKPGSIRGFFNFTRRAVLGPDTAADALRESRSVVNLQNTISDIGRNMNNLGDASPDALRAYRRFIGGEWMSSGGFHKASFLEFAETIQSIRTEAVANGKLGVVSECDVALEKLRILFQDADKYQFARYGKPRRFFRWVTGRGAASGDIPSQLYPAASVATNIDDVSSSYRMLKSGEKIRCTLKGILLDSDQERIIAYLLDNGTSISAEDALKMMQCHFTPQELRTLYKGNVIRGDAIETAISVMENIHASPTAPPVAHRAATVADEVVPPPVQRTVDAVDVAHEAIDGIPTREAVHHVIDNADEAARVARAAAQGDEVAKATLKAACTAKRLKVLGHTARYGTAALGPLIDIVLYNMNANELKKARKNQDGKQIALLEKRAETLNAGVKAGVGVELAALGGASLGVTAALTAPIIVGSLTSEAIYAEVGRWNKDAEDLLREGRTSLELLSEIQNLRDRRSMGNLFTFGYNFRKADMLTNAKQRETHFAAYFARNSQPPVSVQQKLRFIELATQGEYTLFDADILNHADAYADLQHLATTSTRSSLDFVGLEQAFDARCKIFDSTGTI